MKTSSQGRQFIIEMEGSKLTAYQDGGLDYRCRTHKKGVPGYGYYTRAARLIFKRRFSFS